MTTPTLYNFTFVSFMEEITTRQINQSDMREFLIDEIVDYGEEFCYEAGEISIEEFKTLPLESMIDIVCEAGQLCINWLRGEADCDPENIHLEYRNEWLIKVSKVE